MELAEFIDHMQSNYLAHFQTAYDQLTADGLPVAVEIPVELASGRLYTIDFIQHHPDGRNIVVEVVPPEGKEPQSFEGAYRKMAIRFDGAEWDAMMIKGCIPNENALQAWQTRWMDIDGIHQNHDAPFSQVIHSLLMDQKALHIDFGTAKPAAFFSLMDIFVANGCQQILVNLDRK